MRNRPARHPGFTLVEVLVVIGIMGVLVGLLMPAISSVKAESHSTSCLSNLRQIYVGVQSYRAMAGDVLPFTQPLPAATPSGPIGGLPDALRSIMDPKAESWFCPADTDEQTQEIGTSYLYPPGAFMLLEPPSPELSLQQNAVRAARLVTQRIDTGYLRKMPIAADSAEYHKHGNRKPWNGVFIDGDSRILRPGDGTTGAP